MNLGQRVITLILIILIDSGTAAAPPAGEKLVVFVSIVPQKYLVDRIGAERILTEVMVRPGFSPETYEPGPGQLRKIALARIFFRICVPFEEVWLPAITAGSSVRVIECNREIQYRMPDNGDMQLGAHPDPHIWTDPVNARLLAKQILDVLSAEDPEYAGFYEKNFQGLDRELKELHEFILEEVKQRSSRYILVSHAAWGYFCDRYGFQQLSLEKDGRPRGPRALAELIKLVREQTITTLFTQREHRSPADSAFASEIGARVVEIDPLREDYVENLKGITRKFVEATK